MHSYITKSAVFAAALVLGACSSGGGSTAGDQGGTSTANLVSNSGVGDPCLHEGESNPGLSGFDRNEVNVITRYDRCETQVCLVRNFSGTVTPSTSTDQALCTCQCDGEGPGPYCACPADFECKHVVDSFGSNPNPVAGSYCVRSGT